AGCSDFNREAAVAELSGLGFEDEGFQVRIPIPVKISHALDLLQAKSYIVKHPLFNVVRKFGYVWQLRCRPHHLIKVQSFEVSPKMTLVLLQNGTLI
ncbi:hypothetical protein AVEN_99469-1, partial [Araneus ventricosus]